MSLPSACENAKSNLPGTMKISSRPFPRLMSREARRPTVGSNNAAPNKATPSCYRLARSTAPLFVASRGLALLLANLID